jgi:hypothetical protein
MEMSDRLQDQRLQHILDSYALMGDEPEKFTLSLQRLLEIYPHFLVELALVETLVKHWLRVPMPRGLAFLQGVTTRLAQWETPPVESFLTPSQFEQITGLAPHPVFDSVTQSFIKLVSPPLG